MLTGRELGYEVEGHEVFSDVNISVSNGDKIGLVGPNGAGKTFVRHTNHYLKIGWSAKF